MTDRLTVSSLFRIKSLIAAAIKVNTQYTAYCILCTVLTQHSRKSKAAKAMNGWSQLRATRPCPRTSSHSFQFCHGLQRGRFDAAPNRQVYNASSAQLREAHFAGKSKIEFVKIPSTQRDAAFHLFKAACVNVGL